MFSEGTKVELLHCTVGGSSTTFRSNPGDVLARVLDVTGFAMDAVLRIDLEFLCIAFARDLINAGRAIALGRLSPDRQIHGQRQARIR